MSRRIIVTTAISLTLASPLAITTAAFAYAPEETPPVIDNARNSAIGKINADNVYIRSGAGDNYYPTTKLNKDIEVTVVGAKFDWLKIVPPQGSFCYVAKAFVDKTAAGVGAINRDDVNVRAGSELNAMKTTVQAQLSQGQQVKILDEVDEYYKIEPPADAYVFVNKTYVDFVKQIPSVAAKPQAGGQAAPNGAGSATPQAGEQTAVTETPTAGAPTTQPSGAEVAAAPTTQPSGAEIEFDKLEAAFNEATAKTIDQQPLNELLGSYEKLRADPKLPASLSRIADGRIALLKVRIEARDQFLAVQKQQNEMRQKQTALKAEQEEIAQQIKDKDVRIYTAVGTLRTSSIQQGGEVTYRLTDPANGRTVCYLRSNDPKYGSLLGQFIGVKGELSSDPALNLRVVTPSEWAAVDPNHVFRGVGAQIVPPSLLPQASQQASAEPEK